MSINKKSFFRNSLANMREKIQDKMPTAVKKVASEVSSNITAILLAVWVASTSVSWIAQAAEIDNISYIDDAQSEVQSNSIQDKIIQNITDWDITIFDLEGKYLNSTLELLWLSTSKESKAELFYEIFWTETIYTQGREQNIPFISHLAEMVSKTNNDYSHSYSNGKIKKNTSKIIETEEENMSLLQEIMTHPEELKTASTEIENTNQTDNQEVEEKSENIEKKLETKDIIIPNSKEFYKNIIQEKISNSHQDTLEYAKVKDKTLYYLLRELNIKDSEKKHIYNALWFENYNKKKSSCNMKIRDFILETIKNNHVNIPVPKGNSPNSTIKSQIRYAETSNSWEYKELLHAYNSLDNDNTVTNIVASVKNGVTWITMITEPKSVQSYNANQDTSNFKSLVKIPGTNEVIPTDLDELWTFLIKKWLNKSTIKNKKLYQIIETLFATDTNGYSSKTFDSIKRSISETRFPWTKYFGLWVDTYLRTLAKSAPVASEYSDGISLKSTPAYTRFNTQNNSSNISAINSDETKSVLQNLCNQDISCKTNSNYKSKYRL